MRLCNIMQMLCCAVLCCDACLSTPTEILGVVKEYNGMIMEMAAGHSARPQRCFAQAMNPIGTAKTKCGHHTLGMCLIHPEQKRKIISSRPTSPAACQMPFDCLSPQPSQRENEDDQVGVRGTIIAPCALQIDPTLLRRAPARSHHQRFCCEALPFCLQCPHKAGPPENL